MKYSEHITFLSSIFNRLGYILSFLTYKGQNAQKYRKCALKRKKSDYFVIIFKIICIFAANSPISL